MRVVEYCQAALHKVTNSVDAVDLKRMRHIGRRSGDISILLVREYREYGARKLFFIHSILHPFCKQTGTQPVRRQVAERIPVVNTIYQVV